MPKSETKENFFLKLHPLQRVLIGILFSSVTFFFIRQQHISPLVSIVVWWDVFAITFLISSWIVLFKRPPSQIRKIAKKDDGSVAFVFTVIIFSSFASMVTVLLLIVSKQTSTDAAFNLAVTVTSILLSWLMVHTTFTFHYAHLYYDDHENDSSRHAEGLDFPSEKMPNYLDFAYFAFVIGMTFQVSDVQITSGKLRRVALFHGLLAFALNTFVVAFTINIIAGLQKN